MKLVANKTWPGDVLARPRAGAWIETGQGEIPGVGSRLAPARGRGLKHLPGHLGVHPAGSPPRGGVD